jgi:RimJ/RimL family protein N-acetyltransferase
MIPVLETDRLRLRGHELRDLPHSTALWGDREVTRFITGQPNTPEESWARFLRYAGHWATLGYGYWLVEEKASGSFVGEIGFANHKRAMDPPLGESPEIGWVLGFSHSGKGYATEAALAALAWGKPRFAPLAATCIIDPEHRASIRVAEKCDFKLSHRAAYRDRSVLVFCRDWR